jgi:hypothetical protein
MHRAGNPRVTSDFDFLVGEWTVHNRRLRDPLTGSTEWYETPATARGTTFQNGSISVDEMWYPELGFAANSIRLFSPADRTWTIYWVTSTDGLLQDPVVGSWHDGTLVAEGPSRFREQPIIARYQWHSLTDESAIWEQAFRPTDSDTWETNWVMTWRRTG